MALSDEQRAVGREGLVRTNGLEMSVIIRDVRLKPHAVDYLVEPTAGKGAAWTGRSGAGAGPSRAAG